MSLGIRKVDPRIREFVLPTRVVWISEGGLTNPDALLQDDESVCKMTAGANGGVLLDFGQELHGGVRLDVPMTSTNQKSRVRVRFGESVSEAMASPNNDHTIHDFEIDVAWMGHVEVGCTGFRFVRIDLIDANTSIDLKQVYAVYLYRPVETLGSFECSDSRLNEIWRVGVHTVKMCMQDRVWDGIKRDRLVWIGDIHPETRVISAVFGDQAVVRESLDYIRDTTPLPGWMNGISSYSIWWIITHYDWYLYHGSLEYLKEQREYLIGLLSLLRSRVDDNGCEVLDGMRFLEWPTSTDPSAIDAGLQALVTIGLHKGAALCRALGETEAAESTEAVVRQTASCHRNPSESKQANALRVMAGMADAVDVNSTILANNPLQGLSTFYGYYILEARARAQDFLGCQELIRHYWGGMLDLGATSFWEHFEVDWLKDAARIDELTGPGLHDVHSEYGGFCFQGLRHSLCHGWAAGPTAWLSEYVLGVRPIEPGFRRAHVKPRFEGLKWVRGKVPTPYGPIEVVCEHTVDDKHWIRIHAPTEVTIEGHRG